MITMPLQVPDQYRMVRRHQASIVHGPGEAGSLILQGTGVHGFKTFEVNADTGVFPTRLGSPIQAADQSVGALAAGTQFDVRVSATDRDLSNHLLDAFDLNRSLLKNPPDFINQLINDMLITDALSQMLDDGPADNSEAPLGFTLFLTGSAK